MDMILYSLVKDKIANAPKGKIDNVGGHEIRFVDVLPSVLEEDTLYFVLGEYKDGDKINIGGKGISHMAYNGILIDYGILNGNTFFNGYDYNRGYERVFRTSNNGTYIEVENTVADTINYMMIKGQTKEIDGQIVSGDSFLKTISVSEDGVVNSDIEYYININKYFNALPNGMADTLDMTTGVYTQVLETATIDGDLTWQHIYPYGDYREFKIKSYSNNKPTYLTSGALYNNAELMEINENNAFTINSDFVVASPSTCEGKNCIYTYNGALYLRIHNDLVKDGTSYVTELKKYLTNNPITFSVGRLVPKQETILEVTKYIPLVTMEGKTTVGMQSNTSHPIVEVELPVYKNPPVSTTNLDLKPKQEDIEQTEETVEEQPMLMSMRRVVVEETVDNYETIVIDGNFNWQNSAPLGDYREFKCVGFDEQPTFLTEDGYYNEEVFMPFDIDNVAIVDEDSDFIITTKAEAEGECIFVHNGVLYIHICASDVQTGKGMTYAKSFKQYLTDNPITLTIKKY